MLKFVTPVSSKIVDKATFTPIVSVCCKCRKIKHTLFFFTKESPAQLDATIITSYQSSHTFLKGKPPFHRQAFPRTVWHKHKQASRNPIFPFTGSYLRFNKLVWRWHPFISSHINTRDLFLNLASMKQDFLPAIRTREGKQSYQNNTRNLLLLFI